MSKKRKVEKQRQVVPVAEVSRRSLPEGVTLLAIVLRELRYTDTPSSEIGETSLAEGEIHYDVAGSLDLRPPYLAQVGMKVTVHPNPVDRPVEMEVAVTATLRRGENVSAKAFLNYINHRSGALLFPYIREIVSNTSARGVVPAIYLHPVVLPQMLSDEELQPYIDQLNEAAALEPRPSVSTRLKVAERG